MQVWRCGQGLTAQVDGGGGSAQHLSINFMAQIVCRGQSHWMRSFRNHFVSRAAFLNVYSARPRPISSAMLGCCTGTAVVLCWCFNGVVLAMCVCVCVALVLYNLSYCIAMVLT